MTQEIFISYTREDQGIVRDLAADLSSIGANAWYDSALIGGQRWWDQILTKIRDCDVFLFAISGAALASTACTLELQYAVACGKVILPVLVR